MDISKGKALDARVAGKILGFFTVEDYTWETSSMLKVLTFLKHNLSCILQVVWPSRMKSSEILKCNI